LDSEWFAAANIATFYATVFTTDGKAYITAQRSAFRGAVNSTDYPANNPAKLTTDRKAFRPAIHAAN
jgi:hypothetical protein